MHALNRTGAVLAAAAVVAASAAAAPPRPSQVPLIRVATGPIPATLAGKPYSLRLMAMRSLPSGTTVTLTFTRTVGPSTQSHLYEYELGRRALSCTGRRLRCRLDTGRSLGRYGRVRLAVTATRRPRAVAPEPGCTGSATRDAAAAKLSLHFLDLSASLNVFSSGRLPASIRR